MLAFYRSVGEAVLWNSDDLLAVADWGICDELTFHQIARGADLQAIGYEVDDPDALYHASSRQAFVWPYDDRARLRGENLYEDKTSLVIEEVSPEEAITPARVRGSTESSWPSSKPGAATSSGSWMPSSLRLVDRKNELALGAPRLAQLVCATGLGQRKRLGHVGT